MLGNIGNNQRRFLCFGGRVDFFFLIYKNFYNPVKTMNNSERWVKTINRQFIEKDMQMANKYIVL